MKVIHTAGGQGQSAIHMPKTLPAVLVVVLMDIVSDDLTTNRDERNELFCWKVCIILLKQLS